MQAYFTTLFCTLSLASAANILVMLPMPFYSHTMPYMELFKTLAKKGHNVTMVTPYPQNPKVPNMTDIVVHSDFNQFMEAYKKKGGEPDLSKAEGFLAELEGFHPRFIVCAEEILKDKTVQSVIKDETSSYDLVILETFFAQEMFAALGHKYNAPVITIGATGMNPVVAQWTGNPFPTSYFPNIYLPLTDKMTFLGRTKNTFFYLWYALKTYYVYYEEMDALMRKHIVYKGSASLPHLDIILRNISITLLDSHVSFAYPHPIHSNIIEVSGLSLKEKSSLPTEYQKYMDEAKEGVIYFSLGTFFDTSALNPHIVAALVGAFSKLKQKVLMKWHDELPNKSENVKTAKWFPQASILAHPNCKIFISHGGLNGIKEGMFNEIPLITIPLYGDQYYNAELVESFGVGIKLNHKTLTEADILNAIDKVSTDPSYKKHLKQRSSIMRDRPMSALDTAVYWVEYVIRHKGAPHLRPSVLDMPFYQYWLLDVIAFFALIIAVVLTVVYYLLWLLFKCITCRCIRKKHSGKNKNKSKLE